MWDTSLWENIANVNESIWNSLKSTKDCMLFSMQNLCWEGDCLNSFFILLNDTPISYQFRVKLFYWLKIIRLNQSSSAVHLWKRRERVSKKSNSATIIIAINFYNIFSTLLVSFEVSNQSHWKLKYVVLFRLNSKGWSWLDTLEQQSLGM